MALEQVGVQFIAAGGDAYISTVNSATSATNTFVGATESGSGKVSAAGEIMTGALRAIGEIGVAALLKAGQAVASFAAEGLEDAKKNAQIQAQTAAVIKSTGDAAGVSAQHVADYASSLSDAAGTSLFGDDQIQESTNMLLTFTNIKGGVLDAATAISVDMAQALGGAPADAAISLGKALNDPLKGMQSLARQGVTFSDDTKAQVAAMVEMGDVTGAQTIILDELNKEFGGSAQAAADATGGWSEFNGRLGEAKEALGTALLPLLSILAGILNDTILPVVESTVKAFSDWVGGITSASDPLQELINQIDTFSPILGTIVAAITDFVTTGGDLGVVLDDIKEGFGIDLTPFVDGINQVVDGVKLAAQWFGTASDKSSDLGGAVDDLSGIWTKALGVITDVGNGYMAIAQSILPIVSAFWKTHGTEITAFLQTAYDKIISIINLALELYDAIVPPILHAIAGFITEHATAIQTILTGAWNVISGAIDAVLTVIQGAITIALAAIHGDWKGAWEALKTMSAQIVLDLQTIISGFLNIIAGFFDTNMAAITTLWSDNWKALKSIVTDTDWGKVGKDVIDGIISGITANAEALFGSLRSLASDALKAAKDALGISSPSTEFAIVGAFAVQGIMQGFTDYWPQLMSLVSGLGDDLVNQATSIADDVQSGIADAFGAGANIDRQVIKNMDAIEKLSAVAQGAAAMQFDQARRQAATIADPKQAAEYFKLRSEQIIELGKLQDQIDASTNKAERERLIARYQLVNDAQNKELSQQQTNQAGNGGLVDLQHNIAALLNNSKLPGIFDDPAVAQLAHYLNQINNQIAAAAAAPPALMMGLANPPATSGQMTGGTTTTYNRSTTMNMPIYTNQSPQVLQSSLAIAGSLI